MMNDIHHLPCDSCGSSDAVTQYTTSSYCFSCGKYTYVPQQGERKILSRASTLPIQAPYRPLTSASRAYLYQYRLSDEIITTAHVGSWKDTYNHERVVFSIASEIWEAKTIEPGITPKVIGRGAKIPYFLNAPCQKEQPIVNTLVIVEDIISALRLAPYVNVCAMRGTSTKYQLAIARKANNFVIWFDHDPSGHKGASKLVNYLLMWGKVKIIFTENDPKSCTDDQIFKSLKSVGVTI